MKTATRTQTQGNGRPPPGVHDMAVAGPASGRRVRVPELLVGAAIVVGFALAAVLWHSNSTQREPALALANPVERGAVITSADLEVVHIGTDDPVAYLPPAQSTDVIGQIAVAHLPAGTLVTPGNVVALPSLSPGDGVVGLALDPGQYPAGDITPGDRVNVVVPGPDGTVITEGAVVYAVEVIGGQDRRFVSLQASEADANRVAAAAEAGPVRLVLVGQ